MTCSYDSSSVNRFIPRIRSIPWVMQIAPTMRVTGLEASNSPRSFRTSSMNLKTM